MAKKLPKKLSKKQPDTESPLSIGLTPSEIFDTLVENFESGVTSYENFITDDMIEFSHESVNARTGNLCRIVAAERRCTSPDIIVDYYVQLKVDGIYVVCDWSHNLKEGRSAFEFTKASAHKSYINMCGLIGVKVGYGLTANPSFF